MIGHKVRWRIELLQPKIESMTLFLNLVMPKEVPSGQQTTNASPGRGLIEKKATTIEDNSRETWKMNEKNEKKVNFKTQKSIIQKYTHHKKSKKKTHFSSITKKFFSKSMVFYLFYGGHKNF